ncbi:hypothetical protein ONZ45_g15979 [Pleurotus djamor]|nr:hypothetical protein ONZ45_g15979 [Pleurotus djamor]
MLQIEPLQYQLPSNVIAVQEMTNLLIEGKDESETPNPNSKPVRILTDFAIFDPKHGSEMISLEALEDPDSLNHDFVAADCRIHVYRNIARPHVDHMSTGIASIFLTLFSEWPRPQLVSLDPIDLDLELAKYSQLISDQQIPSPDDWPIWRLPVEYQQDMEYEVIVCIFNTLARGNVFFEAPAIEDSLVAVKNIPHTWVDANSSLRVCLSAWSTDCLRYLKYGANENSMALPGRLVHVRPESRPPNSLAYISSSRNAGAILELELVPSSFEDGAAVGIENAPIEVGIDEVQLTHVIPTADEIPPTSQNLLNAAKARFLHRIRLLRDPNDPVWIKTEFTWYILQTLSKRYYQFFRHFYLPQRMTQLIIATLNKSNTNISSIEDLLHWLTATHTILGRSISVEDIWCLVNALAETPSASSPLWKHGLIKYLLQDSHPSWKPSSSSTTQWHSHPPASLRSQALLRNLNYIVLQPENQTTTHVTPLIAKLAGSHFGEQLIVVGPQLPPPQSKSTSHKHRLYKFVSTALAFKTAANPFARAIKPVRRIGDRASPYYEQVVVGHTTFFPDLNKAFSCIINVQKLPGSLEDIIPDADLHTYFWFAKIISINGGDAKAHVQWFEHGSFTALQEFANPQQLYPNMLCDSIPLRSLLSMIKVHFQPEDPSTIPSNEYFYCSTYSHSLACVKNVPESWNSLLVTLSLPSDNCPVCHICKGNLTSRMHY